MCHELVGRWGSPVCRAQARIKLFDSWCKEGKENSPWTEAVGRAPTRLSPFHPFISGQSSKRFHQLVCSRFPLPEPQSGGPPSSWFDEGRDCHVPHPGTGQAQRGGMSGAQDVRAIGGVPSTGPLSLSSLSSCSTCSRNRLYR